MQWPGGDKQILDSKESFEYVILGIFLIHSLEKQFSKLRQGSGKKYFITVQQIFKEVTISKAKLVLNLNSDAVNNLVEIELGHHCQKCFFTLV